MVLHGVLRQHFSACTLVATAKRHINDLVSMIWVVRLPSGHGGHCNASPSR
jgi:hypothetical protein